MEIKSHLADRFVASPPPTLVAALVYGPDQGMVRERAGRLAKSVVPDLNDPFRVAELDEAALDSDPARLWDEAAALSMIGGRRVVRVRGAGNGLAKDFERFLSDPKGRCADRGRSGRAGEKCRAPARLRGGGQRGRDCLLSRQHPRSRRGGAQRPERLLAWESSPMRSTMRCRGLGSDRGVTRVELEKLALYAMGEKTVTAAHVAAVMGDESELRMDETFDAAGEGDYARLDTSLSRLWVAGTSPVAVLRQAMSHFQRLLLVRAETDEGNDTATAMKKLRPPVHFSRNTRFRGQVSRWTAARLEEALTHLYEAEALVKTTAVPAEAACGRALLSVAALAIFFLFLTVDDARNGRDPKGTGFIVGCASPRPQHFTCVWRHEPACYPDCQRDRYQ